MSTIVDAEDGTNLIRKKKIRKPIPPEYPKEMVLGDIKSVELNNQDGKQLAEILSSHFPNENIQDIYIETVYDCVDYDSEYPETYSETTKLVLRKLVPNTNYEYDVKLYKRKLQKYEMKMKAYEEEANGTISH